MPGKHAKLSPSSSARWINCPGSQRLIESLPDIKVEENAAAIEGTLAHDCAEKLLKGLPLPEDISEEMLEHIQYYRDYVKEYIPGEYIFIEARVPLFYSPRETGTCDVVGYDEETKTMHVIDLKYGKGVKVEVKNNTQLIIYSISALDYYTIIWDIEKIVCHIVQPRMNNVCSQKYTLKQLETHRKKIGKAAKATVAKNATAVPGESQCRWCPAKGVCSALANKNFKDMQTDFDDLESLEAKCSNVDILSDEQLKTILDSSDLISSWLTAVHAHVKGIVSSGGNFPGYKLVHGKSNRVWRDEQEVIEMMETAFTPDEVFKKKFVSPAQMEKLLKGKKNFSIEFKSCVNDMIIKPVGKDTLVPESDKRESIDMKSMFDDD